MKKITILLSLLAFATSSALATVSFSGVALSNVSNADGSATISSGASASFFSLKGLSETDYAGIFAGYEAATFATDVYLSSGFFGSSVGHQTNITLGSSFNTGDDFGIVVVDGGQKSFFWKDDWTAPNDSFTVSASTFSGNALATVPEPSTYALIAGFAAFLFVAIRRRK